MALSLDGEIDQGGSPAVGRRPGPGLEVICGHRTAERHVHMGMGIHAPGENISLLSVDHLVSLHLEMLADERDGIPLNKNIGPVVVHSRNDPSVFYQ